MLATNKAAVNQSKTVSSEKGMPTTTEDRTSARPRTAQPMII